MRWPLRSTSYSIEENFIGLYITYRKAFEAHNIGLPMRQFSSIIYMKISKILFIYTIDKYLSGTGGFSLFLSLCNIEEYLRPFKKS